MSNANPTGGPAWELRTVSLGAPAGLGAAVEGVAVDGRRIYLTHYLNNPNPFASSGNGKLVVLDAGTLATLAEIPVGQRPHSVAVNPLKNRIYVVNGGSSLSLSVIDSSVLGELTRVGLGGAPIRVTASLRHNRVYVTNQNFGTVVVVDGVNNTVLASVAVGVGATGIAADDALNRVYVTIAPGSTVPQSGKLAVIDSTTNQIQRTLVIPPDRSEPQDVTFLPDRDAIYVANLGLGLGSGAVPSPRVTVLRRSDFAPVAEIPLPANATHLAADRIKNKVYAATVAGLVVIDGASNRVETIVALERPALGVAADAATGRVVVGDPAGGQATVAKQPGSPFDLTLLRPDDLLHLDFHFHNLKLVTDNNRPRLVREVAGQPAFVVVHFAPQSLAEQTSVPGAPIAVPLRARIAGRSRLAFRVPGNLAEIPYTVESLLDWSRWQPSLVPVALPRGAAVPNPPPQIVQPSATQTAIELPYRLALSPDNTAIWKHAARPVLRGDRAELWQTRLQAQPPGRDPAVRAVWSPDVDNTPPAGAPDVPLSADQRRKIVRHTSDFSLVNAPPQQRYTPEPVEADELALSALGGSLRVRGTWNAPPGAQGFNLALWRHSTTLGRDHQVRVTERGVLFPFGHRAVKVTTTEREITATQGTTGAPVAALRQRIYVVVTEAEKRYDTPQFPHAGREMPFARRVRVLTEVTPDLDTSDDVAGSGSDAAFWIRTSQGQVAFDFAFDIAAEDPTGRRVTFPAQMLFIPESLLANQAEMAKVGSAYAAAASRRTSDMGGQMIAFAEPTPGVAAAAANGAVPDIGLTTESLTFISVAAANGALSFLPSLDKAAVRIPAIEQMLGVAQAVHIKLYDKYLAGGLAGPQNRAAVFAELVDGDGLPTSLPIGLPTEKAGGLCNAALAVSGLSERLGPVVGDLEELARGEFKPESVFKLGSSKLLGTIKLEELIKPITGDPGTFDKQLPQMHTEVERDSASLPRTITTRLQWTPQVKNIGPFIAELRTPPASRNASLEITSRTVQRLDGLEPSGEPDYEIKGVLQNFEIDFSGVVLIRFKKLQFTSAKGEKLDVDTELHDGSEGPIGFQGPLQFIDTLREHIPFDGFSDPPALEVSPRGVNVSYSLGLPPLSIGVFSLQNIALGAGLSLPFVDEPARLRFNFSERHNPFQLMVLGLSGGGFFALDVALDRIVMIEAALEFGAGIAVNLGVARGSLYIMGGVYFALRTELPDAAPEVELTGYLRAGGELSVLGLISVSAEFYMALTYKSETNEVRGQAKITFRVRIAFFSKSVSVKLERRFAGAPRSQAALTLAARELVALEAAPSFGDGMTDADWRAYAAAFA